VLFPGDSVYVPDKQQRVETAATDKKHKFRRRGVPSRLRLQLFNVETPRAAETYQLTIDGATHQGTTDAKGVIELWVPPGAKTGSLTIGTDNAVILLKFGHMDPLGELAGVQKRLSNLGYCCGTNPGQMDDATRDALRSFQRRFELKESGELDAETKAHLSKFHDKSDLFDHDPWLTA
jgi:hypothetical protein